MNLWNWIGHRARALVRRRELDEDMAEEMRLHLEMLEEAKRREGLSPEEARRQARLEFGSVDGAQEAVRDRRGWTWLTQGVTEFAHACGVVVRHRAYAAIVIGTLALGLGASVAMVGVMRRVLYPPLPFANAGRLVQLTEEDKRFGKMPFAWAPHYVGVRQQTHCFEAVAAARLEAMNLVVDGRVMPAQGTWVTPEYTAVLGLRPELGRLFVPEDFSLGDTEGSVVVLNHDYWESQFGGDPGIVGRSVLLGGKQRRVVGVLGRYALPLPGNPPLEILLPMAEARLQQPDWFRFLMVWVTGKLRSGVSLAEANTELSHLPSPSEPQYRFLVAYAPHVSELAGLYRPDARRFWIFVAAVGFLYAIALANATNLALLRGLSRRRELGIRLSLGATRVAIARLLLAENLVLAGAGCGVGLLLARWTAGYLSYEFSYWIPGMLTLPIRIDLAAVAAGVGLALLAACVLSVVPAWRACRAPLNDVLKEGSRSLGDSLRLRRLRASLVVLQTALAVVLLAQAGLMVRSYAALERRGVGADVAGKYAVVGTLPSGALNREQYLALGERLRTAMKAVPGVGQVAESTVIPFSGYFASASVRRSEASEADNVFCSSTRVSGDFFSMMGMSLVAGRSFDAARDRGAQVVVLGQSLAKKLFGDNSPLGRRVKLIDKDCEVIGVCRDLRLNGPRSNGDLQCYEPSSQEGDGTYLMSFLVDVRGHWDASLERALVKAAYAEEPRMVLGQMVPLADSVKGMLNVERTTLFLLEFFSGLGLLLAMSGTFSMLAYAVGARERELALRLALGAAPGALKGRVLGECARLLVAGLALGLIGAWAGLRLIESFLYEARIGDLGVLLSVVAVLFVTGILAAYLPARRAGSVEPMSLLRTE